MLNIIDNSLLSKGLEPIISVIVESIEILIGFDDSEWFKRFEI